MFAKIVLALPFVSGKSSHWIYIHSKLITVLPFEFNFTYKSIFVIYLTYSRHLDYALHIQPLGPLLTDVLGLPLSRLEILAIPSVSHTFPTPPLTQPSAGLGKARTIADKQRTNTVSQHTSSLSLTKLPFPTTVITLNPTRRSVSVSRVMTVPKSTLLLPTSKSDHLIL
jgi:hypothetical protein